MQLLQAELAKEYGDRIETTFVHGARERDAVDRYRVRVFPTLILQDSAGREQARFEGAADAITVRNAIDRISR